MITTDQYNSLLIRLNLLETAFNNTAVALSRCVSLAQVQQLLVVIQEDLANVDTQITSLENRVQAIEEEPLG